MKTPLVLAAFLLLPTSMLAQEAAPPVPALATELTSPEAPALPDAPTFSAPTSELASTEATPLPEQTQTPEPASDAALPPQDMQAMAQDAVDGALQFLKDGGPSIWAIAALSVITFALILWKIWRLALLGAWSRGKAQKAVAAYEAGDSDRALALVLGRRGVRSKVISAALSALRGLPEDHAREETARVAKRELASARAGLGALELISTIAPLLGLLGTVMGMIAAFQALQAAGSKADPSMLAGGIWEALLTTAAGMAVAIPASAALTWFEAVIDRIRRDVEDGATRLFISPKPQKLRLAAE